jgi:CCR4-NOT transcription complex subunit 1
VLFFQSNFNHAHDEMNGHYDRLTSALEGELSFMPQNHTLTSNLQDLIVFINEFKVTQQPTSAFNLVKRLVYNVLESKGTANDISSPATMSFDLLNRYRDSNMVVLKTILSDQRFIAGNWIVKEIQKIWTECTHDYKFNVEGVGVLFRVKLLNVQTVDINISQMIDAGNPKAMQFAAQLIKLVYIELANVFMEIEFPHILDSVSKAAANWRTIYQTCELRDIIEVLHMNYEPNMSERFCAAAVSMMYTGVTQAKDFDDPVGLKEKSETLLHEWITHHSQLPNKENTKVFQQFVLQMNTQGLFKTDDMITRFFRICTESCVETCYMNVNNRVKCYTKLDAFVKLIILLVKHSGDQTNHVNKINLFNKVLGLIAGCLLYEHETKGTAFEPLPFHRLFCMLFLEATMAENNLEPIMHNILQAFVNVFHIIRPVKASSFVFSWIDLIGNKGFIRRMLPPTTEQNYKTWNMYSILLVQLLRFLAPFLRNVDLPPAILNLYTPLLRIFLVLLHDIPDFLCSYHYQLCDAIPYNTIQLRNLVLSAFPQAMKLPDPFTPNLKVDMIGDIDSSPPKITYQYIQNIPQKLKQDLDSYIKTRSPVTFLSELRSYLQTSPDPGCNYNIQLINALVMYVGTLGIQAIRSKGLTPSLNTLTHSSHSAHSDIFQSLIVDLDSQGRHIFLNAVINQLRYPNSHTHYFGCALLNLFSEANSELIQEQIARYFPIDRAYFKVEFQLNFVYFQRVLLERLIVQRPHPWGLLVTLIELVKNPQFKLFKHEFVHCAPEIQK